VTDDGHLGARSAAFDVERIRKDFPILQQRVHGKPLVYLDNAATSQKPRVVIDTVERYYAAQNAKHPSGRALPERAGDGRVRGRPSHGI